jgi:hypothetical protein
MSKGRRQKKKNMVISTDNSLYYRAQIKKNEIVHFVALFRSIEDGIAFERIENPKDCIFEFFLADGCEERFIEIMELFLKHNIIENYYRSLLSHSSLYTYQ